MRLIRKLVFAIESKYTEIIPPLIALVGLGVVILQFQIRNPRETHQRVSTKSQTKVIKMQGCHVLQNEGTDPTFKMPLKPEGGHYKMADPQKQADAEHNNLPSTKCQSHLYNFQPHFFREETCRD